MHALEDLQEHVLLTIVVIYVLIVKMDTLSDMMDAMVCPLLYIFFCFYEILTLVY